MECLQIKIFQKKRRAKLLEPHFVQQHIKSCIVLLVFIMGLKPCFNQNTYVNDNVSQHLCGNRR